MFMHVDIVDETKTSNCQQNDVLMRLIVSIYVVYAIDKYDAPLRYVMHVDIEGLKKKYQNQ